MNALPTDLASIKRCPYAVDACPETFESLDGVVTTAAALAEQLVRLHGQGGVKDRSQELQEYFCATMQKIWFVIFALDQVLSANVLATYLSNEGPSELSVTPNASF